MPEDIKVLVTKRDDSPPPMTLATPSSASNVEIVEMEWWKQAMVRATRSMIQSFIAVVSSVQAVNIMDGQALPAFQLALVSAGLAWVISFLQNTLELTAKWDTSKPGMRA